MPQNPEVIARLIQEHRAKFAQVRAPQAKESGRGIVVCARKRPMFSSESESHIDAVTCCNPKVFIHEPKLKLDTAQTVEHSEFVLDHTFGEEADTTDIYLTVVRPLTLSVVRGGIGTCFAYGQTGSGKTFTITGIEEHVSTDIFEFLREGATADERNVHVSFFEISGDRCFDLLHDRTEIFIREDERGDIHTQNLQSERVSSAGELLEWIRVGSEQRCTRATFKNEASSRTHAVCQITLHAPNGKVHGKLSLIDLAGSERAGDTVHHDQERTKETIAINKSLMVLKECIRNRVLEMRNSTVHVPFRGSRLTLFLKDCFTRSDVGTVVIVTLSPLEADTNHSLNTCWFANRIKEKGVGNSGVDPADPHYWSKKEVAAWTQSILGPPQKAHEWVFTPMTGKRLCCMTEAECIRNCTIDGGGRRVFLALQHLLKEAKEKEVARRIALASEKEKAGDAGDSVDTSYEASPRGEEQQYASPAASVIAAAGRPATQASERRTFIPRRKSIGFAPHPAAPPSGGRSVCATADVSRVRSRVPIALRPPVTAAQQPTQSRIPPALPAAQSHMQQQTRPAQAQAPSAQQQALAPRVQVMQIIVPPQEQQPEQQEQDEPSLYPHEGNSVAQQEQEQEPEPEPESEAPHAAADEKDQQTPVEAFSRELSASADPEIRLEGDEPEEGEVKQSAAALSTPSARKRILRRHNTAHKRRETAGIQRRALLAEAVTERAEATAMPHEPFEAVYAEMKASTSDQFMDSFNGFNAQLNWDTQIAEASSAGLLAERSNFASWNARAFQITHNKMLTELVARVLEQYNKHMADTGDNFDSWLQVFTNMNTGYSWTTICKLLPLCRLLTYYRRLFYVSTPLVYVATFAEQLGEKFKDPKEHAYWTSFGTGRSSICYYIGSVKYPDC